MSNKKELHYHDYLQLDKVLNAQRLESEVQSGKAAHDEMLFIIIHQAYELWFKQIIHELESVIRMFRSDDVDEKNIGIATSRLRRVIEIQELLVQQVRILETMTSLDFLEFRSYLFPASGFQSFQFRKLEAMMGLEEAHRLRYNNKSFKTELKGNQAEKVSDIEEGNSLFECLEDWLERTPFLQFKGFDFIKHYEKAIEKITAHEKEQINQADLTAEEKEQKMAKLQTSIAHYDHIIDPDKHRQLVASGEYRLSYKATLAALLIHLYRDEPILHGPFNLLSCIKDIDELFTSWRYRHAQMVLRMIGRRMGTGGSSGHKYLRDTAEKHSVFSDLHNISTLLIPRSSLPTLPAEISKQLGFYYTDES